MSMIGRGMPRARSYEEYKAIVADALYEISEVRASAEFDGDYMTDTLGISEALEPELKALLKSLEEGNYEHSPTSFGFMTNMHQIPQEIIPFKPLLSRINETHTKGLEDAEN